MKTPDSDNPKDSPRSSKHSNEFGNAIPWWVKSILALMVTGMICYKILETPISLQFDFPAFLSLLLALFSVGLAALFYFKATDTSNAFYDNTYKFSQDVAGLLAKIESGFGERLRHLDETYKGMRESFDRLPSRLNLKNAKKDLEEEEEEARKLREEREKMIDDLVARA